MTGHPHPNMTPAKQNMNMNGGSDQSSRLIPQVDETDQSFSYL